MPHFKVELNTVNWGFVPDGPVCVKNGYVRGLPDPGGVLTDPTPDTFVLVAEVPPAPAGWNGPSSEARPRTFYSGDDRSFSTWHDALHATLYDLFQVHDGLKEGDTFECTYDGETVRFECKGFHVIRV